MAAGSPKGVTRIQKEIKGVGNGLPVNHGVRWMVGIPPLERDMNLITVAEASMPWSLGT